MNTVTILSDEMLDILSKLFVKHGFESTQAQTLSSVFTENTLCGVSSHGINRVPLFVEYVKAKLVKISAKAELSEAFGNIERWDGNSAAGILNAIDCTKRSIALAKESGMGLVALKNTNHWMRGGYYAWLATQSNCTSIMFTNTKPNMPAWGTKELRIGNNPFVIGIPNGTAPVVLDMAMSQFSFGKIENYQFNNQQLPVDGGWDSAGQLTKDPSAILETEQSLPIGYWKGSGLSIVLDMLATVLSGGQSSGKISQKPEETDVSQIYICIDNDKLGHSRMQTSLLNEIIQFTRNSTPLRPEQGIFYPGEQSLSQREESLKNGMAVNNGIWNKVLSL